jgi:hypothetical protein
MGCTQLPCSQRVLLPVHLMPQPPQLKGSVFSFTQWPPQHWSKAVHSGHTPPSPPELLPELLPLLLPELLPELLPLLDPLELPLLLPELLPELLPLPLLLPELVDDPPELLPPELPEDPLLLLPELPLDPLLPPLPELPLLAASVDASGDPTRVLLAPPQCHAKAAAETRPRDTGQWK